MMRICIYNFYDKDGIVDQYVLNMLIQLRKVSDYIIFVSNGKVEKQRIIKYVDAVLVRENKGLDGGAYKVAFREYASIIEKSNEVVLCNNSFFGFFVPIENIFADLIQSNSDVYGLVPWRQGGNDYIQSYFLVIKAKVFKGEAFKFFLDKYIDENTESYDEICFFFERELQYYLQEQGFKFASYIKEHMPSPYQYPHECIMNGVPIMKKKCFDKSYRYCDREELLNSLTSIENIYNYDVKDILECVHRKYGWDITMQEVRKHKINNINKDIVIESCDRKALLEFYERNDAIYIYGAGAIAKQLLRTLKFRGDISRIKGLLVSHYTGDSQNTYGIPVIEYNDSSINESDGVIIAMNPDNTEEILNSGFKHENSLFFYRYCK